MDGHRFDDLARAIASSRRSLVKTFAAGTGTGLLSLVGRGGRNGLVDLDAPAGACQLFVVPGSQWDAQLFGDRRVNGIRSSQRKRGGMLCREYCTWPIDGYERNRGIGKDGGHGPFTESRLAGPSRQRPGDFGEDQ